MCLQAVSATFGRYPAARSRWGVRLEHRFVDVSGTRKGGWATGQPDSGTPAVRQGRVLPKAGHACYLGPRTQEDRRCRSCLRQP